MASVPPLHVLAAVMLIAALAIDSTTGAADQSQPPPPKERYFSPASLGETDGIATWRLVSGLACGAIAAALSSAGGVGGGGLYVPIFNLLLGFSSKRAAALSTCMVFGGTLVNLFWYVCQRSADGHGPLIDYQIALLCLPNVLLGISLGVFCNVASPSWLVTLLLIVTLFVMTFRSCQYAFHRWNAESCTRQPARRPVETFKIGAYDEVISPHQNGSQGSNCSEKSELESPLLEAAETIDLPQYPALKICSLLVIWIAFLAVQIVRGTSDGQNIFGIETCGPVYWIVTSSQVPFALLVTAFTLTYLQQKNLDGNALGDKRTGFSQGQPASEGLITVSWLPAYALVAGFLGGMLGLGGGTIISPLLLETGMHPQVTAATCSFMVFFSSSLSVIQYWLSGKILVRYALAFGTLSLVFSVIGLQLVQTVIVKYRRVSLIVFAVSTVMGISAVLMAFFGTWEGILLIEQGEYMGFQSPC